MPEIDLSFSDFDRVYADLPAAPLKNRFFEENPFQGRKRAAIARPGTSVLGNYGTGPIRKVFSQPGLFDGALFFVSGEDLYRWDVADYVAGNDPYTVTGAIQGTGEVSMSVAKGLDYERLFIADGVLLQFYGGGTRATGTVAWTGGTNPSDGDGIRIGTSYYTWNTTLQTGRDGSSSAPWSILIGAGWDESFANLVSAISFTTGGGTVYSAELAGQNDLVTVSYTSPTLTITSRADTAVANTIGLAEIQDTLNNLTLSGATLTGADNHGLNGIEIPEGLPPTQVGTLKSHIIVGIGRTDRFYFIKPAQITIGALDFATAESQPDELVAVRVTGDTAWLIGQSSTEVWYATGDPDLPFTPVSGRTYDRGALEGTVVSVKGTLYLVDQDYIVYAIAGGPQRISNHGIEETIRKVYATET